MECEVLDVMEVMEEETVIIVPDFDPHISVYIPFMEQVRLSHTLLIIPGFLWVGIQFEHFKTNILYNLFSHQLEILVIPDDI